MAVNPSPFGPKPQFEISSGVPAIGNKLFFYVAGSVGTKQNTYTSSTGLVANTNPVILDALGMPTNCELWFTAGQTYKVVYAPSTDTDPPTSPIWTIDNLLGINDTTSSQTEWIVGPAPTFVSATSFTLVGDQTTNFHVGRRIKSTVTAGTSYGTITASAFGASTTVTVDTTGSNPIDSGLSAVSYGLLSAANFAQSIGLDAVTRTGSVIASATTTNLNAAGGDNVHVSGTTTITAITLAQGHERTVVFDGALILTNGASLILPGGANITTAAGDTAIFRGEASSVVRCISYTKATSGVLPAGFGMSAITNSLGVDVALNNTGTYFDGPSIAQGTAGTWFVSGTVTLKDTAGSSGCNVKLWDGTTVIASCFLQTSAALTGLPASLSGFISAPAGNLRISVKDSTTTTGVIQFNSTGNSKDSTITAIRIA